jgi:DNA modification methylase
MTIKIINADVMDGLAQLADESVHCVVTSPPYFGLRDYGTAKWDGGSAECDHKAPSRFDYALNAGLGPTGAQTQNSNAGSGSVQQFRDVCGKCGARRVDKQIGIEPTPAEFVNRLVEVFRDVRRVLRDDGTCWLNMGDSYNSGASPAKSFRPGSGRADGVVDDRGQRNRDGVSAPGFKPKDLLLIPERLAIALCDDGWYIRSRIIWHKPNPMPESVTDRPTKSHEHIWLMSKAPRYYYDAEAIAEEAQDRRPETFARPSREDRSKAFHASGAVGGETDRSRLFDAGGTRNARDVWTIATSPFAEAHFATFPPELAERCIKAGTSEKGCCAKCGAPWGRQVERETRPNWQGGDKQKHDGTHYRPNPGGGVGNDRRAAVDMGWAPSCSCDASAVPCTVLDPFGGSGTTGLVADRLQRNAVLIELNPEYAAMAKRRLTNDAPLFAEVAL